MKLKSLFLLSAALPPTAALAGSLAAPVMEITPIVQEAQQSSSSAGLIIPLILIALIAVALSSKPDPVPLQMSDARTKTDIRRVGTSPSGLPLYQFRYIGLPTVYEGVMAQDVELVQPEAVVIGWHGFKMVNYSLIDATLKTIH